MRCGGSTSGPTMPSVWPAHRERRGENLGGPVARRGLHGDNDNVGMRGGVARTKDAIDLLPGGAASGRSGRSSAVLFVSTVREGGRPRQEERGGPAAR